MASLTSETMSPHNNTITDKFAESILIFLNQSSSNKTFEEITFTRGAYDMRYKIIDGSIIYLSTIRDPLYGYKKI